VLTSLQTNLINGVYISPYACTVVQWHTKVKYMLDLPLADSNGAILISKKKFSKLSASQQEKLKKLSREYFGQLTLMSRKDNKESLELLKETGITFTTIDDQNKIDSFYESGKSARRDLIGKLYDEDFLLKVEGMLDKYRSEQAK
jgi:TRAP-type C4-dicarboxylate transport system substrate-binding protein